jgi:hypothetical protein
MKILIEDFISCLEPSIAGVTEIYMKSRSELGEYWFYNETNVKQYGEVIGISSSTGVWYKIVARRDSINFQQTQANEIIRRYNQSIDLTFNKINYIKRDLIEQLVVSDDIVVIFKDRNGIYWLMGETEGTNVNTWNFGTGSKSGLNETSLQMTCSERFPIREIDPSFINSITPTLLAICDLDWTEICANNWTDLCADYKWNL